jgi:hypothetical protein
MRFLNKRYRIFLHPFCLGCTKVSILNKFQIYVLLFINRGWILPELDKELIPFESPKTYLEFS